MKRTIFNLSNHSTCGSFQKLLLLVTMVGALEICSVMNADAQRHVGGHGSSRGHFSRGTEHFAFGGHRSYVSPRFFHGGRDFYYRPHFYRPFYGGYSIFGPRLGFRIGFLPAGCFSFNLGGFPYYYYDGTYYAPRDGQYEVVAPPLGAVVETLPSKYDKVNVDGQTYYTSNGVQYKPVMRDGEIWYKVIKSPVRAPEPEQNQNDDKDQ